MDIKISEKANKVLNYIRKHNCNLIMKYNYGIQVYRIYNNEKELSYPRINEDIYCEIRDLLTIVSGYGERRIYALKQ